MSTEIAVSGPSDIQLNAPEASSDDQLIALWLHGRSRHTQRAYLADVDRFRGRAGKTFASVTLSDLQDFAASLEDLAARHPVPGAVGGEVAARLWTPNRLSVLRRRPRAPVAIFPE